MKVPKTIKLAGKVVVIKYKKLSDCYGYCDFEKNTIFLARGLNKQLKSQTLVHEVVHFINCILEKNTEVHDAEKYVGPLSELLFQFIEQTVKE